MTTPNRGGDVIAVVWPRSAQRSSQEIQTLRAGEFVRIHLRDFRAGEVNAHAGRIVDVDGRAIRLDVTALRIDLWWQDRPSSQLVIPWHRVDEIVIGTSA